MPTCWHTLKTPYYSILLDQIETDSYHMAVRQAMDAIVTRYDHDVE
jgi:hypothetical protein